MLDSRGESTIKVAEIDTGLLCHATVRLNHVFVCTCAKRFFFSLGHDL